MAITGINNSSCTSYYASNYKNSVKKTDSEKDSINTKDGNVTTSTVELKTSRPGVTKTEQIKTGYSNVNDYSKYLQEKYHYVNTGTTSMQGVPTTVSVSSAFLQKCMNDPEKAKYLEENLAAINMMDLPRKIVSYKKFCRSIMIKCTKKICLILIQWHISNQNIVM